MEATKSPAIINVSGLTPAATNRKRQHSGSDDTKPAQNGPSTVDYGEAKRARVADQVPRLPTSFAVETNSADTENMQSLRMVRFVREIRHFFQSDVDAARQSDRSKALMSLAEAGRHSAHLHSSVKSIGVDVPNSTFDAIKSESLAACDTVSTAARRMHMYIDPCFASAAPRVQATSSGLTAFQRERLFGATAAETDMDEHDHLLNRSLLFPETRLIEYDCGKLQQLAVLLQRLHTEGHRCLIFTQMSKMLDVLEAFLCHHGYVYLRLDGATRIEHRQILMERFNTDAKIFAFILSTRSGGIGINLTGADTVIFYDSDWNPTMDAQAQDRCHRVSFYLIDHF